MKFILAGLVGFGLGMTQGFRLAEGQPEQFIRIQSTDTNAAAFSVRLGHVEALTPIPSSITSNSFAVKVR